MACAGKIQDELGPFYVAKNSKSTQERVLKKENSWWPKLEFEHQNK